MLIKIMRCQFALLLAALIFSAGPACAHNIPVDATVQMFVKPQGHTLHVLVRVPLTTYTDADYPRRAGDYVDLDQGRSFACAPPPPWCCWKI